MAEQSVQKCTGRHDVDQPGHALNKIQATKPLPKTEAPISIST
jgi:hypothetical protein